MDRLIKTLKYALERRLRGCDAHLERVKPLKKIGGFVVWEGFVGKDQVERQSLLWKVIRKELEPESQGKITAILTLTPEEVAAMRE